MENFGLSNNSGRSPLLRGGRTLDSENSERTLSAHDLADLQATSSRKTMADLVNLSKSPTFSSKSYLSKKNPSDQRALHVRNPTFGPQMMSKAGKTQDRSQRSKISQSQRDHSASTFTLDLDEREQFKGGQIDEEQRHKDSKLLQFSALETSYPDPRPEGYAWNSPTSTPKIRSYPEGGKMSQAIQKYERYMASSSHKYASPSRSNYRPLTPMCDPRLNQSARRNINCTQELGVTNTTKQSPKSVTTSQVPLTLTHQVLVADDSRSQRAMNQATVRQEMNSMWSTLDNMSWNNDCIFHYLQQNVLCEKEMRKLMIDLFKCL